jgi:hypothetical protein
LFNFDDRRIQALKPQDHEGAVTHPLTNHTQRCLTLMIGEYKQVKPQDHLVSFDVPFAYTLGGGQYNGVYSDSDNFISLGNRCW